MPPNNFLIETFYQVKKIIVIHKLKFGQHNNLKILILLKITTIQIVKKFKANHFR